MSIENLNRKKGPLRICGLFRDHSWHTSPECNAAFAEVRFVLLGEIPYYRSSVHHHPSQVVMALILHDTLI
jgi:hypothetical protein